MTKRAAAVIGAMVLALSLTLACSALFRSSGSGRGCDEDSDCPSGERCDECASSSCPDCDDCIPACVPKRGE